MLYDTCPDCGAPESACICDGEDNAQYNEHLAMSAEVSEWECTCGGGLDGVHEPGCGLTPETHVPTPRELWEYETEQNPLLLPHWGWRALTEWWDFQDMGGSPVLDIPAWAWNPFDLDGVPF